MDSQRSSSPARATGSSPPVSPTITQTSSRCSTPSPTDAQDSSRRAPLRSSSPPRSSSPGSHPEEEMDPQSMRENADESDHGGGFQRPAMPSSSMSAPAGHLPRLLPHDTSQFTTTTLPTSALPSSLTSLSELAHLVRKQQYQEQRRSQRRVRLHRWLVSAALSARLTHCGELAYRALMDYYRNDDRKSFATLYNALHDVRSSCDATRRYALLEPDLDTGKSRLAKADMTPSFSTFMHEIPQKYRSQLLAFLTEIRNNPNFLAARIVSLEESERLALANFRPALESESVLATGKGGNMARKAPPPTPNPIERLLSFQRHDPLSALIFTAFANSAGPDSAEDRRRTEAWATVCARLIVKAKRGTDMLMTSVLSAWAAMRDWPAKANIELYLMEVLQEGQFLLDKANHNMTEKQLLYATDEFFSRSVKKLFDMIDDEPSAGGMPEGVWEISTAIMDKISKIGKLEQIPSGQLKHMRKGAEQVILFRWFFSAFLPNAIVYPESHGIMMGYHIPTLARERILKGIAIMAQQQAATVLIDSKFSEAVMPEVKKHIESLLARLRPQLRSSHRPVLLPAKSITSPRETVEVHPFLVLCPSDLVTMVNALFPERKSVLEPANRDIYRRGLASAASSISGISIPPHTSSTPGDGSSVLSMSISSMTSDATSREPLLNNLADSNGSNEDLSSEQNYVTPLKVTPTEEYGRRIREACSEMTRILGPEATGGSCHPCAERWAVIYVTHDGRGLRIRMQKDFEDDDECEDESPDNDSEDDDPGQGMDLANDYHQLKESIVKLLSEYELPKIIAPESESKAFSNRTATHKSQPRARPLRRADPANRLEDMPGGSLASQHQISSLLSTEKPSSATRQRNPRSNSSSDAEEVKKQRSSDLVTMLESAYYQCQTRNEFVNAHQWYQTLERLNRLSSPSLTRDGYGPLLNYFARGPRDSLSKCSSAIEHFDAWFAWLKQSQQRYDESIDDMMTGFKNIRDKMWFKTAVLTSAGYEEAKNIAAALKLMSRSPKLAEEKPVSNHKRNQFSRSSTSDFLVKTPTQVMELIASPADKAGPNKLVDEQAELTLKWITTYGIENFCKGEERIHRFCMEVDKCVNKLVGDGVLDAPVLWSSELYRRDREILDSGRQKGDLWLTGVGNLSIASDEEYETGSSRPVSRSLDFVQYPSQSSLRSVTTRASQQSLDSSSKWSSGSRTINLMDAQDYFGLASPALAIDSAITFWSPFQTSGGSPSNGNSNSNIRPTTSSSSTRSTTMLKNSATVNTDKRKFLLDLKQTLTGLLLSDLGTLVFNHGSETDGWFSGDIGERCIQRKEAEERRRKLKLARKKSMRSLKSASRDQQASTFDTLGRAERSASASPVTVAQHADATHSAGEHSTSSSNTPARSSGLYPTKTGGNTSFPYDAAYRRLLDKFARHPNPFCKLHALYELEVLIIASLSSKSGRHYNGRRDTLPPVPQSPTLGSEPDYSSRAIVVPTSQAQNLNEAIANVTERRSYNEKIQQQSGGRRSPSPHRGGTRSLTGHGPPSTDMIVNVLQSLFRDADIRPKTLFRDLQYIAAFVPPSMLDKTPRGKAFWDAGLAALGLKQDVCRYMVEIADDIVAQDTQNRSASHAGATPTPENQKTPEWTMSDAAHMYIITAMEGDAVGQRELAILFLTHPELLERRLLPFSKPKEIFKESLLNKKREDPNRSDPLTVALAQHWMEMSKLGGDELAARYLRQRNDMERIS